MSRHLHSLFAFTAAILLAALPGTAVSAKTDSPITYRVVAGDNLHSLARKYMVSPQSAEVIRKLNKITDPKRMQTGTVLRIPRYLLQSTPVQLEVESVSGTVSFILNGNRTTATKGAVLKQGMEIKTGRKSFVALKGKSGSLVSLPSRSHAKLRSAKRYKINNALDVDLEIINGRSSIRAPKLRQQERFRTRTPVAVSAVRGTEYRVAFDLETSLATTEVVEGAVAVSNDNDSALADAGFGVATTTAGVNQPEALLSPPEMIDAARTQTGETVTFAFNSLPDAQAYRVQIADGAGSVTIVDDQLVTTNQAVFTDLPNGRYVVRARAVAQSGLEGLSDEISFRRQKVGVTASVDQSPLADGFKFAWLSQGDEDVLYGFQLWREDTPGTLLVDELGTTDTSLILTNLDQGKYVWRVAALQMVPEGLIKVWGSSQKLTVGD